MEDNPPPPPALPTQPAASYSLLYLVLYKWWRLYNYYLFGTIYEPEHVVTLSRISTEYSPACWDITLDNRQPERCDYVLVWPSQWSWFCAWYGRPLCETPNVGLPLHYRGKIDNSPLSLAVSLQHREDVLLHAGAEALVNLHSGYDRVHVVDNFHIIRAIEQQRSRCDGSARLGFDPGVHLQAFVYGHADESLDAENPLPNAENPNPNAPPPALPPANPTPAPIRGFRGLQNDNGVSCYMNAVVQCLLHVPEFVRGLSEEVDQDTFTQGIATEFKNFAAEYFREDAGGDASCSIAKSLKEAICDKMPLFRRGQQDACELWENLIRCLQLEIADFNIIYCFDSPQRRSFVEDLFVDTLIQSAECPHCRSRALTLEEPARLITLPYVNTGGAEIDFRALVDAFFLQRSEVRSSSSSSAAARCDSCGESIPAGIRRTALRLSPDFLIFQLPRNIFCGGVSRVDNTPVRFALRGLDMRPHAYDEADIATYDLYAAVNRLGSDVAHGHYTADVASAQGYWTRCDDEVITVIPQERLDFRQAYLLFYRKRREGPPEGAAEQRIGEC